jgi:glucose/arabinose dehydrogenase
MSRVQLLLLLPMVSTAATACGGSTDRPATAAESARAGSASFEIDTVAGGFGFPWSLAMLPDGGYLVAEKDGQLVRLAGDGATRDTLTGVPPIYRAEDSGLHDVVLDPDYASNQRIYFAYVEGDSVANRIVLYRATIQGNQLVDGQAIFRSRPDRVGPAHPGGRLLFLPDATLLLTLGDAYYPRDQAQNPASGLGKIVRVDRDGGIPPDNPFVHDSSYLPEIFSLGHRNPQGLALDPRDSLIWEHEHGPRGGDELNMLRRGSNYGWPVTTFGIDYDGTLISGRQIREDIEGPWQVWVPSIAPSGMAIYLGDRFPQWHGDLFVGALAERSLRRIRLRNGKVVLQEVLLQDLGSRIRDVRTGPDGLLYLLTDEKPGYLLRLRPR